ncbi:MAG: class I SAM-dependent methyltransferase [Solirubrobacteraceae bacterium MAG38_C4-C5]|nr:class I SAM-dependent methyltransferase [Candidatus Siliceabacter maunaloa]
MSDASEGGVSRRALFTGLRQRLLPDEPATEQDRGEAGEPLDPATRLLMDWGESDGMLWRHAADTLVESVFIDVGHRVLDAGCGDGNLALAAARMGAEVVGCDPIEPLVERARERADAEGLKIDWRDGDLESLPFADGEFDAALSTFAPAFCVRPKRALHELARVTRPGGRIAVVLWGREGAVGRLLRLAAIAEAPVGGGRDGPVAWATADAVRDGLKGWAKLGTREPVPVRMAFDSREEAVDRLTVVLGPLAGALARLPADRAATLRDAAERAVAAEATERGGRVVLMGHALLVAARRGSD